MKKSTKAFTFVELLAVFVVLSVIALIASPIILKIITDSQETARMKSVKIYAESIEAIITTSKDDVKVAVFEDKTYTYVGDTLEQALENGNASEIIYSGSRVICSTINYSKEGKGYVELEGCRVGENTTNTYRYSNHPETGTGGKVLIEKKDSNE